MTFLLAWFGVAAIVVAAVTPNAGDGAELLERTCLIRCSDCMRSTQYNPAGNPGPAGNGTHYVYFRDEHLGRLVQWTVFWAVGLGASFWHSRGWWGMIVAASAFLVTMGKSLQLDNKPLFLFPLCLPASTNTTSLYRCAGQ